jgi:hypothetical protein
MKRHLLHAVVGSVALVVCLALSPSPANAQGFFGGNQGGILNDPFSFYYAFYLPNQQLQALRPTPNDTINQAMVSRQYYAQNERMALTNPISPYSDQGNDPLRPYSRQGQERMARPHIFVSDPSNLDGSGPSLYFNRGVNKYHPRARLGRGPNANVNSVALGRASKYTSASRAGTRGGGGMGGGMGGMGGMGGGMGGMGGGMGGMGGGMGGMGMM